MMLVEETQVPEAALPVAELKAHLRLGTGFAEDDVQNPVLGSFLRAAMAAIEARIGKALIERGFVVTLPQWRKSASSGQALPLAPVSAITELALVDRFGVASVVEATEYRLIQDSFTPRLAPISGALPNIPENGAAEIRLTAGYGAAFGDLPADLQQAVLLLAAHFYEYRDETALSQGCMPFGVTSLIARYRPVRMGASA